MKMKACRLIALTMVASWVSLLFTSTAQATSDYDNLSLSGGQPRIISSQCNIDENLGSNWEDIINNQSKWMPYYAYLFSLFHEEYEATKENGKGWALLQNKVTYSSTSTGSSRMMDEDDTFLTLLVTPIKKDAEFIYNDRYAKHLATKENTWMLRLALSNDCSEGVMVVSVSKNPNWDHENQIIAWDNSNTTWLGNLIDIYPIFINYDIDYPTGYAGGLPDTTPLAPPQLDYLALGDSYSSGEGDTVRNPANHNKKYYRDGTDVKENTSQNQPQEKCHISTRSYPYVLAKGMQLKRIDQWNTIACSGAQSSDVKSNKSDSDYKGQDNRLKNYDADTLKSQALNEFIPGREQQIKFVEKYKPKVITLTMGGNDIGFGDKVAACASPSITDSTCDIATNEGKSRLAKEIKNQYGKLKTLYEDLYRASGNLAKIYVLGYPKFINGGTTNSCGLNIGSLNGDEREMIESSVVYMNNVIKQSAKAAGVKYVDTQDALDSGRLCDEGQKYVTGVTGYKGWNGNEIQESFHPNAKGNLEIAMTVWDKVNHESLLDYDICPNANDNICPDTNATKESIEIPDYFQVTEPEQAIEHKKLTDEEVVRSGNSSVSTEPFLLKPNSSVSVTLHSDPIDLGAFATSTDGSLEATVTIPSNTPVGYHTLLVDGETYSGEPIQYEQTVLVKSSDPDDIDDNGIVDTQQPCGPFMQASNTDADLDGIDDACDPEISETPELYRVRQGDAARDYNGSAEYENYLYIERNTRASSITGISGDYDPDSDGWAVVGVSKGTEYTGSTAPDTAPAANFIVTGDGSNSKPYVYLRAGGFGCTSFTPTSLVKVQQGQSRTIKKVDYNTDKCRQEEPGDDVDGDGQPDDTQPLYTARNGDTSKNEDPTRIYLFRNFHSAEAQLGISDYSPTGTPAGNPDQPLQDWNLFASSKQGEYIPTFNKLVILNPEHADNNTGKPLPIILTKKQNNQCIAYKPESTDIIKRDTQKKLAKLSNIPEGVSCE